MAARIGRGRRFTIVSILGGIGRPDEGIRRSAGHALRAGILAGGHQFCQFLAGLRVSVPTGIEGAARWTPPFVWLAAPGDGGAACTRYLALRLAL